MKKTMRTNLAIALFAALSCAGCDQISKHFAKAILQQSGPQSYFSDMLRFHYTENPGVAFSLGADLPRDVRLALFTVGPTICLAVLLVYMFRTTTRNAAHLLALGLVLGGGMGNLIDRIFHDGRVIDFLNLGIGTFRTAVFNIADTAISMGMLILLITAFFPETKKPGDETLPQHVLE